MIRRLCVFDFDGTLFNSPEPPEWWSDKEGWWDDVASLNPPMVPRDAPNSFWIGSTVTAAKEAIKDEGSYVVLLTGRTKKFSARVRALLNQKGLEFDEIRLSDQKDTQAFKVAQIRRILKEHSDIEVVDLWEDMTDMVPPYRATAEEGGAEFNLHKVKVKRRKPDVAENDYITERVASRFASLV